MKTLAPFLLTGLMAAGAAMAQDAATPPAAPAAAPASAAPAADMPGPDLGAPAEMNNGIWYTADGNPTFNIADDGTLDYATYQGYVRYTGNCMQCHGPDGLGSTYAPALAHSVLNMDYSTFLGIVAGGRENVNAASNNVMPTFGTDKNVMCYIDDIYAYLLARGTGKLDRGRPAKKDKKSDEFRANEDACMG